MTIVHLLEKNAREFPNDVALVEINPEQPETRRITWSEFELVESSARRPYRREITWSVFEEKQTDLQICFLIMVSERVIRLQFFS